MNSNKVHAAMASDINGDMNVSHPNSSNNVETNLYYDSSSDEDQGNHNEVVMGVDVRPEDNQVSFLGNTDNEDLDDADDDNLTNNKELFANLPSFADTARSLHTANTAKKTMIRRRSKRSFSRSYKAASSGGAPTEQSVENIQRQKDVEKGEMEIIRSMGAPMGQRRSLRNFKMEQKRTGKVLGRDIGCWKLFKLRTAMSWKLTKSKVGEFFQSLQLWRGPLKEVEGRFGNGVLSYFVFLKSLFILNIIIFVIELLLVVPQALINYDFLVDYPRVVFNKTPTIPRADYVTNQTAGDLLLDFFTGQGYINTTIMFYSNYYGKIVAGSSGGSLTYDMPLAYIMVGGAYMILSFLIMVRSFSERFTESILESSDSFQSYCNKVFASWDYCIVNERAAELKKNVIYQDFIVDLEEERRLQLIKGRTRCDKFKIFMIRLSCNFLTLVLLVGSVYAIYLTVIISTEEKGEKENIETFFRRWASSLTITALNLFLPTLFEMLANFEQYSPHITVVISLWRAVMLKLASLIVLMVTLFTNYNGHKCNVCWENHIAAQMFNLIIVDFIVICTVTIFMETTRKYASMYLTCNVFGVVLGDKIGRPEFQIPKNILDLVYGQALIWIGTFFAPLLPVLGILKLFIIFYVKKISLVFNCKSSSKSFQGARSNYFITLLLLLTFVLCTVGIGYAVAQLHTSQCGPYSNPVSICSTEEFMISIIGKTIDKWPIWIASIISFIKTSVFLFPLFIVIFLLLYYYHAMTTAHEKMIELLQGQLKIEGRDKRFLMNRLVEVNKKLKK